MFVSFLRLRKQYDEIDIKRKSEPFCSVLWAKVMKVLLCVKGWRLQVRGWRLES